MAILTDIIDFIRSIVGDQNLLVTILVIESSLTIGLFIATYRIIKRMRALIEQINDTSEALKNDMYLISGEINKMHNVLMIIDGKNNEIRKTLQLLKESNVLEQLTYADYIRYAVLTAGLQKQMKKDIDKLVEFINEKCKKYTTADKEADT